MPKISALSGTSVFIFERIRTARLLSDELLNLARNPKNTGPKALLTAQRSKQVPPERLRHDFRSFSTVDPFRDHLATENSHHGPALHLPSLPQRPSRRAVNHVVGHFNFPIQVHHHQVRIGSGRDHTLLRVEPK